MNKKPLPRIVAIFFKDALIVCFFVLALLVFQSLHHNASGDAVAQSQFWNGFPGVEVVKDGIHFAPLGRLIIHQDGSPGQPNPPVNIAGEHLKVQGDFTITFTLSDIDQNASLRLYAAPPIVYDQWRYETPSLGIMVTSDSLTAETWNGSSSESMDMRLFQVQAKTVTTVMIEVLKGQVFISENGQQLGSMPDHSIFKSGEIWLGADSSAGSKGFVLNDMQVEGIGSGSVTVVAASLMLVDQSDADNLRNLSDANARKIKIGAAVSEGPLFTDEAYRQLALGQFSIITPENSMKPQFIHPQKDVYDFAAADSLVAAALLNGVSVHGHVLVYDKSTPDWMKNIPVVERESVLRDHVATVAGHFKGKVAEWDVVNEALSGKNALYKNGGTGLEQNFWYEAMGEKYIDIAFEEAHQADPSAKLYLNDYGLENDGQRWDAMLALVKRLQARGVPISGVGFESHIYGDGDYVNEDQLRAHMQVLAKLGLAARISEIDVTGDDAAEQVTQYVSVLDACLRETNCTSYSTWGITDAFGSTTRSDRYPLIYGTSLLWDKDMKGKPALAALQKRLKY